VSQAPFHSTDIYHLRQTLDLVAIGGELYDRAKRLYPICRSITGDGVRETLALIGNEIPLVTSEIPSGTRVFDWTVPREWNIRDAYVTDEGGRKIIDFAVCNLHVLNYSIAVDRTVRLAELQAHLFSIPEQPDLIPYKTSYYAPNWGFCMTDRQRRSLTDGEYHVRIDSSLEEGHLTLAECVLPGEEDAEILVSCHVCHPSLCNDNLSGITVAVTLARLLEAVPRRYAYRFLFIPGTIGAITWLALNERTAANIRHGLVLSCLGDRGNLTYKRSRRGNAEIDRIAANSLATHGARYTLEHFSPYGYDERQYCSPGFDLPVGVLSRTPHGRFPEYHTSADNLEFITPEALSDSLDACLSIFASLEGNRFYRNLSPKCEPQLGRRGLYSAMGGHGDTRAMEQALLWVLNYSDGRHSLLDIVERSGLTFDAVRQAASLLLRHELLAVEPPPPDAAPQG
jgi:aminopeptidase-like protein